MNVYTHTRRRPPAPTPQQGPLRLVHALQVMLPLGPVELSTPIKVWIVRNDTAGVDTRALGVSLASLGETWASVQGGSPSDLAKGLTLSGQGGGLENGQLSTNLIWKGGPNQVVIDIPAPWAVTLRNFGIDGSYVPGVVGIRYRAGYEFAVNGGKENLFQTLALQNLDIGVSVGGPLLPDIVGSRFDQMHVVNVRIGFQFFGANVAGQWLQHVQYVQLRSCRHNIKCALNLPVSTA